jgi:acetyltransferase
MTNSLEMPAYDLCKLADGSHIRMRPVMPQDSGLLGDMLARLSPASRRNRFHVSVNQVPPAWLRNLACVDQQRHVAFVMTTVGSGQEQIIADARYVVDARLPGDSAEFAIVVDEQWRRRGLGEQAMRVLRQTAQRAGLRSLHGDVLAHNRPMLGLLQKCDFCCTPHPEDASLMLAESALAGPQAWAHAGWLARLRHWLH